MKLLGLLVLVFGGRSALAGEDLLWRARHFLETGHPERSLELTAAWLNRDWSDAPRRRPEAVVLHLRARARALGEGPRLERALRPALDAAPDSPELRVSLAAVLAAAPQPDCGELGDLLLPLPADPWVLAATDLRRELAATCGWSVSALDLSSYPADAPDIELRKLQNALNEGVVDEALAWRLEDWYRAHPTALALPGSVYGSELSGPGLPIARLALEAAVQAAAESDDPMAVYGALTVLRWRGADERELARRMDQLQPGWSHGDQQSDGISSWMPPARPISPELQRRLHDAAEREPVDALRALRALRDDLPAEPRIQAAWHLAMAQTWEGLDRAGRALRAYEEAWLADPTDRELANRFAWAAAEQNRRVAIGLEAITAALATVPRFSVREGGLESWPTHRAWSAHEQAFMRDTRAWLLYRQGRLHEARDELLRALLLLRADSGTVHMHLGLVLAALDEPEAALFHLSYGLGVADPAYDDLELRDEAHRAASALWSARRWQPGGLDAWIDTWRQDRTERLEPVALPSERDDSPGPTEAEVAELLAVTWLDAPLPDLELLGPSGTSRLSELGGWRVVDFWAAWCGPCVEGLPGLKNLVAAREDLSLVVVSVEDAPPVWDEWLGGAPRSHGRWGGPAVLEQLSLPGIPATFLLDPEGRVRAVRLGGTASTDWLEEALSTGRTRSEEEGTRTVPVGGRP
jgi:thiol-disulfide isomerase/thioredoxin